MFGQLCVVEDPEDPDDPELPGVVDVDGEALVEGEALAACATANVPKPPPMARAPAIISLATLLCTHSKLILFTSLW
jgi:hypothetical protein